MANYTFTKSTGVLLKPGVKYQVKLKSSSGDTVIMAEAVDVAVPGSTTGERKVVVTDGTATDTAVTYTNLCVETPYLTKKYDVFYTDSDSEEESHIHGSVYTVPKVEPKQWRTITTVGTTTTYGDWKLLSQATPEGTEGTNYEYMKETYIVRDVKVASGTMTIKFAATHSMENVFEWVDVSVHEVAEVTDEIHGDVVSKFRTPNILENIDSYTHTGNETNGGVLKTRRIKNGNLLVPLTANGGIITYGGATGSVTKTQVKYGMPIGVIRFKPPTGKTITQVTSGAGSLHCRMYNSITGEWSDLPTDKWSNVSPADAQGCTKKYNGASVKVTGPVEFYFTIT